MTKDYDEFLEEVTPFTNLLLDYIIMQYQYQGYTFETAKKHGSMFLWYFMGLLYLDKDSVLECYDHRDIFKHIHELLNKTYPYYDDSYLMQLPDHMSYSVMKVLFPQCEYAVNINEEYANIHEVDNIGYTDLLHPLLYWLAVITTFNREYMTIETIGYIYEHTIDSMEVMDNQSRNKKIHYSKGLYNIYLLKNGWYD